MRLNKPVVKAPSVIILVRMHPKDDVGSTRRIKRFCKGSLWRDPDITVGTIAKNKLTRFCSTFDYRTDVVPTVVDHRK